MARMQSDRGFISGFISVGIHMTIQHILQHILIANRCKKELAELKELVMSIELTIMHIQKNRLAFRSDEAKEMPSASDEAKEMPSASDEAKEMLSASDEAKEMPSASDEAKEMPSASDEAKEMPSASDEAKEMPSASDEAKEMPSAVNGWLEDLDSLLLQASKVVQLCSRPKSHCNFSGFQTKKKINLIISDIRKHEELSPLLVRIPNDQVGDCQKVLAGLEQTKDRVEAMASCATTSQAATAPRGTARKNLTVEEQQAFANLEKFLTDNVKATKICVLGKTKRGETLILKNLFESQKVRNHFSDGLFLWLTVSQRLSVTSMRKDLCNQIDDKLIKDVNDQEELKIRLNQTLQQSRSFVLFLEDVWGRNAAELLQGLGILDAVCDHIKCKVIVSSTDPAALLKMEDNKYTITIDEPVIVGQKQDLAMLEKFVTDDAEANKIGVVGKCGAGKTLLLKTLFNRQQVRSHFSDGLLLWLSVSQRPSVTSLRNDLCKQIAIQKRVDLSKAIKEEEDLSEQLRMSSRFLLFLDDVWGNDAETLIQNLGIVDVVSDPTKSKIIASSRDPSALSKMGVADKYTITIQDLNPDDSWQLFKHHAFPYNIGNLPSNIDEGKAKPVCDKCAGLPQAIKVVGKAMAASTHPQQWEWAFDRLTKADSLDDYLRLNFDALGNQDFNMQLCFLHIAVAFLEDEIIDAQEVIPLWMGEGLLAKKMLQHEPAHILADHCLIEPMIRNTEGRPVCLRMQDPFQIGMIYLDLLAERCLIEPTARDADGRVLCFRMLKVVRDLAIPIAKNEENFYSCVGNRGLKDLPNKEPSRVKRIFYSCVGNRGLKDLPNNEENFYSCVGNRGLKDLPNNEPSKVKRIFLSGNDLRSLKQFSSYKEIRSLLISQETGLTKISKQVIGNMRSLKVLDLSGTSARSLPENVGCLKELICLKLSGMPIKRLPKSLRDLGHLEILDVSFTGIKELPSDIHMLRSLRYLGLRGCKYLQNLPNSISGLLSLQYLYMDGCSLWTKPTRNRCKSVASMKSLGDLVQLKQLALQNDWEAINELGILGSMAEMDSLLLILPNMECLTLDINNMSKLRSLSLKCCNFTKIEIKMRNEVCSLKNLSYLKFYECQRLEDLQNLHKLQNLRHLEIILCQKVRDFPKCEEEAFPLLRIFSLVGLQNLVELPDAMPFLEIFTIMDCPKLKMLPETYLNLGTRIRVYGCPEIVEDFKMVEMENMDLLQVITISISAKEIIQKYLQVLQKNNEDWLFGESWCNELFLFVKGYIVNSDAMNLSYL